MLSKTDKIIKRVAFFGDAEAKETDVHYKLAYETAKLLAINGYVIINGGGPGIMLASTLGAAAAEGKIEVVIIDENVNMGANYEGSGMDNKTKANIIYRTETIQDRTEKLIDISDAFIIFKGGTGTMAELSLVWEKAKFAYGSHKPLIFVGDFWKDIIEKIVEDLNFDKIEKNVYEIVNTPAEVLETLRKVSK